jgi:hypothetical protein
MVSELSINTRERGREGILKRAALVMAFDS